MVLAALTWGLTACASTASGGDAARHADAGRTPAGRVSGKAGGFTTTIPKGFRVVSLSSRGLPGYAQYIVVEPSAHGLLADINVVTEPAAGEDIDTVAPRNVQHVMLTMPSAHQFSRLRAITLAGEPAREVDFLAAAAGRMLHLELVIAIHGGSVYAITYTAFEREYSQSLAAMNAVLRTWKWQ